MNSSARQRIHRKHKANFKFFERKKLKKKKKKKKHKNVNCDFAWGFLGLTGPTGS